MDMAHCFMCMKTINSQVSYTKQKCYSAFNERQIGNAKKNIKIQLGEASCEKGNLLDYSNNCC